MALSGRLVLLALAGLLLIGVSRIALVGYAGALLLAVLVDLAWAARIRELQFRRDEIASVRQGESTESGLRIVNGGRRPLRGRIRDAWVPSAGATPREQNVDVPRGEQRRLVTTLTPTRRGDRPAACVVVRSYGPLRIAARQRRLPVVATVRVLPAFPSRRLLPEKFARLRQIEGAVLMRHKGEGSEFDSLREYVTGDDVRAIDWRATARARNVVVRTWRPERDRHIVLALDTGRAAAARVGDAPRLDAALDACLLLAAIAARAGDRVALVAADVAVRARLGLTAGADVLPKLVTALASLDAVLVETDPQLLAAEVLRAAGTRSLVVLFTTLEATASEDGLLPAVRALVGRHRLIVAAVGDPRVDELAADQSDSAAIYSAGAAELDRLSRLASAERLSRLGALVVDAPPDTFAARVTDSYLDLKAAGRL